MDLDRYLIVNRPGWQRLRDLAATARRRPSHLTPVEVDELVRLHQRASTHLSHARNHYRDPTLTAELTAVVSEANASIYRRTRSPLVGSNDLSANVTRRWSCVTIICDAGRRFFLVERRWSLRPLSLLFVLNQRFSGTTMHYRAIAREKRQHAHQNSDGKKLAVPRVVLNC